MASNRVNQLHLTSLSRVSDADVPSSVNLLSLPFGLSQSDLLTPEGLLRELRYRGLRLDRKRLELLHRRRALVPMFRIYARRVEDGESRLPSLHAHGTAQILHDASRQGRLRDPGRTNFTPWGRRRSGAQVLYSRFQLLATNQLKALMPELSYSIHDREVPVWSLPPLHAADIGELLATRRLAILLEVLATRYKPKVLLRVRGMSSGLDNWLARESPPDEYAALIADPTTLLSQAETLLFRALAIDPLGEWHRVIRIANRRRWSGLRFDALVANDYRRAAEILLLYYEDLAAGGGAEPLEPPSGRLAVPRLSRLESTLRERAETIMDFHLESTPAVVLAVEGDTEAMIVPRVLEMVGLDPSEGLVDVVNLKSVEGDVRLLARSVSVPRLESEGFVALRVLRPLTGLVVAVDPEHRYATPERCATVREGVIEEIMHSLPPSMRTPGVRRDVGRLVHVHTWGSGGPFEFAHFDDDEIAAAIESVAGDDVPESLDLKRAVGRHRSGDRNLENVWKTWRSRRLTKPALAAELWPILKRKIEASGPEQIPILRVALAVAELVARVRGAREFGTDSGTPHNETAKKANDRHQSRLSGQIEVLDSDGDLLGEVHGELYIETARGRWGWAGVLTGDLSKFPNLPITGSGTVILRAPGGRESHAVLNPAATVDDRWEAAVVGASEPPPF